MNQPKEKTVLEFESALSMEEIEKNFEGADLFAGMMTGLEQALAYTKGEDVPVLIRTVTISMEKE